MAEWTFLTNHAMVLSHIACNPRITALEISKSIGITERATRRIIDNLLEVGYIAKKRKGRCNHYRINPSLCLRHSMYREVGVGDFLELLGWKNRRAKTLSVKSKGENSKGENSRKRV